MMDERYPRPLEPHRSRRLRLRAILPPAALALGVCAPMGAARAQYIEQYFPYGTPGYETQQGVTVLTRQRPLYESPGIHVGDFVIRPEWDQGIGYDSNVNGLQHGTASSVLSTGGSVSANSLWSQNSLGATLSVNNSRYFDAPAQSYTNWTASVGGGYTIGQSELTLGYSHLSLNEIGTQVGAVPSLTPIPYTVDDLRTQYTFDRGRLSFTPTFDMQYFQFSDANIASQNISQTYRNRVVFNGGVTTRYALSDQRNLILVVQGVDSHYTQPQAGLPTFNSWSALVLGGLDYVADGPWRYRVLFGVESRFFASRSFPDRTAPIFAAEAIYTPTGLTTLTASLSRTIEDPSAEGTAGYIFTSARLVVDHELLRNVLLQGRAGYEIAQYLQGGGSQNAFTVGGGVTWLLNRNLRLSLDYDFTDQTGGNPSTFDGVPNATTVNNGPFTRNLAMLTLRFAL